MSGKNTVLTRRLKQPQNLTNVIGDRGEKIFELAITDYQQFKRPLFKPGFLGEKWPTIDYYVELLNVPKTRPFFFAQVKATTDPLPPKANVLQINVEKAKCEKLYSVPGPTYIVGVHEPTKKAYILSIHSKPSQGVYSIPLKHELTPQNLRILYNEVRAFWKSSSKPTRSYFI